MKKTEPAIEVRYIEDDAEGDEIWIVGRIRIPTVVKILAVAMVAAGGVAVQALIERKTANR